MEDEVFEIERILRSRINKKGEKEYRVQWKGWSSKYNSWVPETDMATTEDLESEDCNSDETKLLKDKIHDQEMQIQQLQEKLNGVLHMCLFCHASFSSAESLSQHFPTCEYVKAGLDDIFHEDQSICIDVGQEGEQEGEQLKQDDEQDKLDEGSEQQENSDSYSRQNDITEDSCDKNKPDSGQTEMDEDSDQNEQNVKAKKLKKRRKHPERDEAEKRWLDSDQSEMDDSNRNEPSVKVKKVKKKRLSERHQVKERRQHRHRSESHGLASAKNRYVSSSVVISAKVHYCPFCHEPKKKMPEHWEDKHETEPAVCQILAMPKKSKTRRRAIASLKKEGDFIHNSNILRGEQGELVVHKRPKHGERASAKTYTYCNYCKGLYKRNSLYRHKVTCPKRPKKNKQGERRKRHQREGDALMATATSGKLSKRLQQVFSDMDHDQCTLMAKNDALIVQLGENYLADSMHTPSCHHYVSQKMRETARLLEKAREVSENVVTAKDLIDPVNFETVIDATLQCSKFDENTCKFETPSLARKHGHILNRLADIVDAQALKEGCISSDDQKKAEGFKRLMAKEWSSRVSGHSLRQAADNKWESPKPLPLNQDIMKLNNYLSDRERKLKQSIELHGVTKKNYSELGKVTLSQVILFNRRRPGETQFLKLQTYKTKLSHGSNAHPDVISAMPLSERVTVGRLSLVYVRGKKDRGVPLLLPKNVKQSLDLLVSTRNDAGVSKGNPYVFARCNQSSDEPHRGCDCLREFGDACGAEHREYLTTTNLRKHVATMSQLINLQEREVEQLATHLGHDIAVHWEFYRLPQDCLILSKVGKLLEAMDKGKLHLFQGKKLEDIDFDTDISECTPKNVPGTSGNSNDGTLPEMDSSSQCSHSEVNAPQTPAPSKSGRSEQGSHDDKNIQRNKWTEAEEQAVRDHPPLMASLRKLKTPSESACQEARDKYPCLRNRTVVQIKSKVWNMVKKKRKQMEKSMEELE